ncbi:MAG: type II toxin-antitoxin system antitoxin SocA domain-containing protein [Candidatus Scalindua sp.]
MKSINEVKQFIIELLKLFPNKETDLVHIGKAYYYANRYALEDYGTLVSTHHCVKLDYGPGIDDYREIFDDLVEEGVIYRKERYLIGLEDIESHEDFVKFPEVVLKSIKKAYSEVKDKDFDQLKEETHCLKSYQKALKYSVIDYSEDIFTEDEINEAKSFLKNIPEFKK